MNFQDIIKNNINARNFIIRYWSYIIRIEHNGKFYYVKIPKKNPSSKNIFIDIKDDTNRITALSEYRYLNKLYLIFSENNDMSLGVVRPIEYNEKYNAIITEEFKGDSLLKFSRSRHKDMIKYYSLAGKWLNIFHKNSNTFTDLSIVDNNFRIYDSINYLTKNSYNRRYLLSIYNKIKTFSISLDRTVIIEGFELRNFLINNGSLCFLDPTLISNGNAIDDIARFFVSIDMLYWDRIEAYFAKISNDIKKKFLESYFLDSPSNEGYYEELLSYYIVKWFLIRWKEAYINLNTNRLYTIFRPIISQWYIDHLFCKWINMYIGNL